MFLAKRRAVPAASAEAPAPILELFNQQEFFTMKEAAIKMRCSRWTIREACYVGDLPHAKLGKSFIIRITDLREWFERKKKRYE